MRPTRHRKWEKSENNKRVRFVLAVAAIMNVRIKNTRNRLFSNGELAKRMVNWQSTNRTLASACCSLYIKH